MRRHARHTNPYPPYRSCDGTLTIRTAIGPVLTSTGIS